MFYVKFIYFYRDLKPENILLDDNSEHPIIKVIDWGGGNILNINRLLIYYIARYYQKNKKMTTISGTPYYIAPEVLNEDYDDKCDTWSCGVLLYILLCGYPPFNGDSDTEIMKAVKKGNFEYPGKEL